MARPSSDLIIVSVLLQRISVSSLKQSFSISLIEELFEDSNGKSESVNRRWTDNTMTQKERQRSTKHYIENHRKDRATRTPLKMVTVRKSDSPR